MQLLLQLVGIVYSSTTGGKLKATPVTALDYSSSTGEYIYCCYVCSVQRYPPELPVFCFVFRTGILVHSPLSSKQGSRADYRTAVVVARRTRRICLTASHFPSSIPHQTLTLLLYGVAAPLGSSGSTRQFGSLSGVTHERYNIVAGISRIQDRSGAWNLERAPDGLCRFRLYSNRSCPITPAQLYSGMHGGKHSPACPCVLYSIYCSVNQQAVV